MTRRLLPLLAAAAAAAILSFRPIYEPDIWWHLAHGRENAAGHIVHSNVFSFTYPDYRQRFTTWLFDTTVYGAWRAAGAVGVQIVQALFIALALWLMGRGIRARAPAWTVAALFAIGFFVLEPRAIPRPHLVSFAGMAICALLVERAAAEQRARPLYWAVPAIALWSNFHVECVFGVVLIAIFAACELVRPAALSRREALTAGLVSAACVLATMANPYGWGLIAYMYENLSVPEVVAIAELRPPYLPDYRAVFVYAAAGAMLLALEPRRLALREVVTALVFGAFAFMHLRMTPLLLFATAPMVAARLARLELRGVDRRAVLVTVFCGVLALSRVPLRMLVSELRVGTEAVEPRGFFSPDAVAFIARAGLEGPVFNSHNLGGYLAWSAYPRVRVFQDSRLQAYPPELFRGVIAASRSQADWDDLVRDVDWAVLSVPRPNQLSGAGRFPSSEWATVFEDQAMQVVVRRGGRYSRMVR